MRKQRVQRRREGPVFFISSSRVLHFKSLFDATTVPLLCDYPVPIPNNSEHQTLQTNHHLHCFHLLITPLKHTFKDMSHFDTKLPTYLPLPIHSQKTDQQRTVPLNERTFWQRMTFLLKKHKHIINHLKNYGILASEQEISAFLKGLRNLPVKFRFVVVLQGTHRTNMHALEALNRQSDCNRTSLNVNITFTESVIMHYCIIQATSYQ